MEESNALNKTGREGVSHSERHLERLRLRGKQKQKDNRMHRNALRRKLPFLVEKPELVITPKLSWWRRLINWLKKLMQGGKVANRKEV